MKAMFYLVMAVIDVVLGVAYIKNGLLGYGIGSLCLALIFMLLILKNLQEDIDDYE